MVCAFMEKSWKSVYTSRQQYLRRTDLQQWQVSFAHLVLTLASWFHFAPYIHTSLNPPELWTTFWTQFSVYSLLSPASPKVLHQFPDLTSYQGQTHSLEQPILDSQTVGSDLECLPPVGHSHTLGGQWRKAGGVGSPESHETACGTELLITDRLISIHSFNNKYLLNGDYEPGIVLGTWNTSLNKIDKDHCLTELQSSGKKKVNNK